MRLATPSGRELWLAYGMNVHPGGTAASTLEAIDTTVLPLRERLGVDGPFGVALRFNAATVDRLHADAAGLGRLVDTFERHRLVPFTANGFVLGAFHGRPVKEGVYAPTWREDERVRYTVRLAEVMARLGRGAGDVSISTAPGSWRAWGSGPDVDRDCAENLARVARRLRALHDETGVRVVLGLEPEPGCTIDTAELAADFFERPLASLLRDDPASLAHLGLCYDVCHQAVMHEDVEEGITRLLARDIPVVKVQASCALELSDPSDAQARAALSAFDEPVYLHQVGARDHEGRTHVADDLATVFAEAAIWESRGPWRIHFHVPVFRDRVAGLLGTTQAELDQALLLVARGDVTSHLEIETYTWDVLPDLERRAGSGFDLVGALAREYEYVLDVLTAHGVRRDAKDEERPE